MSNNIFLKSNNRFIFLDDKNNTKNISKQSYNQYKLPKLNSHSLHSHSLQINNTTLFPHLNSHQENNLEKENNHLSHFKDILINTSNETDTNSNNVLPGWTRITRINGKSIIEYGEGQSNWSKEEEITEEENTPNDIMLNAFNIMKHNWDLYETNYDSVNGEGSYDKRFRLPLIFNDDDNDDNNDNDNSDNNNENVNDQNNENYMNDENGFN
jgi:hypothetical protein